MSFVFTFDPTGAGMTVAKYDQCIKKLEVAGQGSLKGRLYHVCYDDPADLHVTDVWDTMENFQAFGETLMPILQEIGVDPGQPKVNLVNNIIIG